MTSDENLAGLLSAVTDEMAQTGIRRLLVLAGEPAWTASLATYLKTQLPGDWLWLGDDVGWSVTCAPSAVKTLLGREFRHGVFDAREGLDAGALAAVSGTLMAGSWLVLLTPAWSDWTSMADSDALRWGDGQCAIPAPRFIGSVMDAVRADSQAVIWHQYHEPVWPASGVFPSWVRPDGDPSPEQKNVLHQLEQHRKGVAVVTAARGRGKSALAGMLIHRSTGRCVVTAPTRAAADVLVSHADKPVCFSAPDRLIADAVSVECEWLIIDEAAAIPLPLLSQLISRYPRVLLTTTVQGYEGTGRGFLLKFCATLSDVSLMALTAPIRWAAADPLETLINTILLLDEPDLTPLVDKAGPVQQILPQQWPANRSQMSALYLLLSAAHYRTTPLDWRRMLDAPGQSGFALFAGTRCAAGIWLNEEGGLTRRLSYQIWAGFRRPRGNLVAQSLAAHGGSPDAARLKGLRINRIAVHPSQQRCGLGQQLIAEAIAGAEGHYDYLSASFGYTPALGAFWSACGFLLVRIGTQPEASSGCYTAIVLYPLSTAGRKLAVREQQRFFREILWLTCWRQEMSSVSSVAFPEGGNASETEEESTRQADFLDLTGFAFAHRPLETCLGALYRMLATEHQSCPLLAGRLLRGESPARLCQTAGLAGRKALLAAWRLEVQRVLYRNDARQASRWQSGISLLR